MRDAQPRDVEVVPPTGPPAGSVLVAEGAVELEAPAVQPGQTMRFVPFTFPARGRADMALDWNSPQNGLDFVLFEGTCTVHPCAGRLLLSPGVFGVKPLPMSYADLAPGEYTLRIDNTGPGADTARYEVRLTTP
jgi:hypothetical protein